MKKAECERAIRELCLRWRNDANLSSKELEHPSFHDFVQWLNDKGYAHYLDFQSVMGPLADAELWFDDVFKQAWRR